LSQTSAAAAQVSDQLAEASQVRLPWLPQLVVQLVLLPGVQQFSSACPLQSSSKLLPQSSPCVSQAPQTESPVQVRRP